MMFSLVMLAEGRLLFHTQILVKHVPEKFYVPNVPAISISFLLHDYGLNHEMILCLSNRMEWVDSSWCNSDQYESNHNICDSKLQNFRDKLFQLKNYFLSSAF